MLGGLVGVGAVGVEGDFSEAFGGAEAVEEFAGGDVGGAVGEVDVGCHGVAFLWCAAVRGWVVLVLVFSLVVWWVGWGIFGGWGALGWLLVALIDVCFCGGFYVCW